MKDGSSHEKKPLLNYPFRKRNGILVTRDFLGKMKTHDPKRKCFGEVGINDLTRSLSKYLEDVKTNMSGNIVNQADQIVSLDFGYDASRGLDTGKCIIVNNEPQFTDVKSLVDKIRANKQRGSRI